MFQNIIKIVYRNLVRSKFYSLLNILGLATGIIAAILILLFVGEELTYDHSHQKHERIYSVGSDFNIGNKTDLFAVSSVPIGPALKLENPEVVEFVRFLPIQNMMFRYEEKEFVETDFYYADSTVFDVFTHRFIVGDPKKALVENNSIVLTQTYAEKYFGQENPIGKTLVSDQNRSFLVTGVVEDLPKNVHLRFNGLVSLATLVERFGEEAVNTMEPPAFWNVNNFTYILLSENAKIESVEAKFPALYEKYMKAMGDQINAQFKPIFVPLAKLHHNTIGMEGNLPTGNMSYVYIFLIVGVFILVIASINYMNMATARSAGRAKEVGIRKVSGAFRSQLLRQFLTESVILSLIAMLVGLFVTWLILPEFNHLTGKELVFSVFNEKWIFMVILGITLFTGLVSGLYPALYLSGFQPVKVLKGTVTEGRKGTGFRRVLVVFQFFISIAMIIGTMVVSSQLTYLRDKDMGFDDENVMVLPVEDEEFLQKIPMFREELMQNPKITNLSSCTGVPGNLRSVIVMRVEKEEQMTEYALPNAFVDYEYLNTLGIELVEGRFFDREMGTDLEAAVVINETAARKLGWGDQALGKKIDFGVQPDGSATRNTKVIGVMKDYNFKSLHNPVEPLVLFLTDRGRYYNLIKIKAGKTAQTIEYIREKWQALGASSPLDFTFLKNDIQGSYTAEVKIGKIFAIFAFLSIFISLLGLLGLSSFIAERKTREIGIRKVLGASIGTILQLLYKEFALLVAIAFVIAAPVAWVVLDRWLQDFAYHTSIQWGLFVLAFVIAMGVALLTITFHSLRAARANPVDAIKYE